MIGVEGWVGPTEGRGVDAVRGAEMGPGAPAGTAAAAPQLGQSLELHLDSHWLVVVLITGVSLTISHPGSPLQTRHLCCLCPGSL